MENEDTPMQDTKPLRDEENNSGLIPHKEGNADVSEKYMQENEPFKRDLIPDVDSSIDSSEKFDNESIRIALAKMVIVDELPFKIVECKSFRDFTNSLEPRFQMPSWKMLAKDCRRIYLDERRKLRQLLSDVNSRVCISIKKWTSLQNLSYLCLTAHFMDDDWKLHRKILNFCLIPCDNGEEIGETIESSVLDWGIKNVGTFTVENSVPNYVAVKYLKNEFHKQNCLLFGGEFFHINCSANILNLLVRDCLDEMQTSVARIRDAVIYVWSSSSGAEKFKRCITQQQITSRSSIYLDVENRWSSTYFMLDSALNFQRAFEMLQVDDPEFLENIDDGAPMADDWNNARVLVKFLRIFYDTSRKLSGSHVTSSLYFNQVCYILSTLDEWSKSSEMHIQSMALKIKERFNIYWGSIDETNLLLLVSVALDPCCKVRFVRFCLTRLYPTESEKVDSLVNQVIALMKRLFDYYKKIDSTILDESDKPIEDDSQFKDDFHLGFKKFMEEEERAQRELELQRYLEEGCEIMKVDDKFNILSWWKMYSKKYRVLSKIAKDLLSIPVSTLDSKSACSFGDPALGEFQSSLPPVILESLICAKNWLETSLTQVGFEEDLEELEKLDLGSKDMENDWTPFSSNFSSKEWPFYF